jgi:hypothetical protein
MGKIWLPMLFEGFSRPSHKKRSHEVALKTSLFSLFGPVPRKFRGFFQLRRILPLGSGGKMYG